MNLTFYQNSSDPRKLDKTLSSLGVIENCAMRDVLDVENPTFRVASSALPSAFNYVYCDYTQRFYFTEDPIEIRTGLYDIKCRSDVLANLKTQLRAKTATVTRNENMRNGYLLDQNYKAMAYRECVTKQFPNAMTSDSMILITVG